MAIKWMQQLVTKWLKQIPKIGYGGFVNRIRRQKPAEEKKTKMRVCMCECCGNVCLQVTGNAGDVAQNSAVDVDSASSTRRPHRTARMSFGGGGGKHKFTLCLKNDTPLACYNFDIHRPILIIFGRNVTKRVSSQMIVYFLT